MKCSKKATDVDSISTIHSDDSAIIKRRKRNMHKIKGQLSTLEIEKIKPVKERRNNNNTKPKAEEIIEILQHKKFRNRKIKIKFN